MESIFGCHSEKPPSSSFELTWFDKFVAAMQGTCSKLEDHVKAYLLRSQSLVSLGLAWVERGMDSLYIVSILDI